MNSDIIAQYWQAYLDPLPPDSPVRAERYMVEGFGEPVCCNARKMQSN